MDAEQSLRRKITWRVLAPLAFLTFVSNVDRSNIALAALQMNREVGLSPAVYGLGTGLCFYAGYILLQYPHTASLRVLGAREWVTAAVVLWGLAAASTALIRTPTEFFVNRFVLGALEGGYAAGATALATLWMPRRYRISGVAFSMVAIPLSQIFGAPLSGWLMTVPISLGGVTGWRMMILIEGAATVLFGLIAWFRFGDRVEAAPWLSADEQRLVAAELAADAAERPSVAGAGRLALLGKPGIWISAAIWFCLLAGALGVMFWMAQVVKQAGAHRTPFEIGVISAMPWVGVGLGMVFVARSSDRTGERALHLAGSAALGAACLVGAVLVPPGWAAIGLLVVGGFGLGGAQGVFWSLPLSLMSREATTAGITIIAMIGNVAGLVMIPLIGYLRQRTGEFTAPIFLLAGMVALAALLALTLKRAARA